MAFDPDGRPVTLPERVIEKVLRGHLEMADHIEEILETVAHPDHRERDPYRGAHRERYYKGAGPRSWLRVVVEYVDDEQPMEGFVVTAFGQEQDPR